eukprot:988321-Prorocentrum_minimum.AAC.1
MKPKNESESPLPRAPGPRGTNPKDTCHSHADKASLNEPNEPRNLLYTICALECPDVLTAN